MLIQTNNINLSDSELIEKIVKDQLGLIELLKRYEHQPMKCPPLTQAERKQQDAEWQEAIKRGLHIEINRRIDNAHTQSNIRQTK